MTPLDSRFSKYPTLSVPPPAEDFAEFNFESPLIIVGAGGSGSTLLDRTLNAHPGIRMLGEQKFLLPAVWQGFHLADANTTLRRLGEVFGADPELESRVTEDPEAFKTLLRELEARELRRRGAVLGRAIRQWFDLCEGRAQHWGFKEITNSGGVKWDCYDWVFPGAIWIHVIRNPLDRLPAAMRLSGRTGTYQDVAEELQIWVATIRTSRARASTGRYFEVRYEDLRTDPHGALAPLFAHLELPWSPRCGDPLHRQWGAKSPRETLSAAQIEEIAASVDGLQEIMDDYGYRAGGATLMPDSTRTGSPPKIEPIDGHSWRIVRPILQEEGLCWEVDLADTPVGSAVADCCDDVGHWKRSPLQLFEDDQPLPHPHSFHFKIREWGMGRYSHWQQRLLFSTLDRTDPNENGRVYRFKL